MVVLEIAIESLARKKEGYSVKSESSFGAT